MHSLPACFCSGTQIQTDRGEIPVEALTIGDNLITASGNARALKWIGRRRFAGKFAYGNKDILPVQIKQGALDFGVPRQDLFLSPAHALFLDGMLIPAGALVNRYSIVQAETVDQVSYFHLELETHDVILAEGAPAESFAAVDGRGMFHNAKEFAALYPQAANAPAAYCAIRRTEGAELESVKRWIAARALQEGFVPEADGTSGLRGRLDVVTHERVEGWARDEEFPDRRVTLRVMDNDVTIGVVTADSVRPDLVQAGIGDGGHGFALRIPGGLARGLRHVIQVQRVDDGRDLAGSPWMLDGASAGLAAEEACRLENGGKPAAASLDGRLDTATRDRISGWARDAAQPEEPVSLQLLDNGKLIGRVLANRHRADLEQRGMGSGRFGFELRIPGGLAPHVRHVIQVRRAEDGQELPLSPRIIEAAGVFDPDMERSVAEALASVEDRATQDRALAFVTTQAALLLQRRAEADGGLSARQAYAQFRRRWGASAPETVVDPGKRALVVDDRVPDLARDAGSQVIISHARALMRLGYRVSFVASAEYMPDGGVLEAEGVTICRAPWYASVEDVLRLQSLCFDAVYLHRVSNASRYLALARHYCPRARILYSVADLHHLRLARQAAVEDRPELLGESRRVRLMECTASWMADAVLTHSPHEAAMLREAVPTAKIHVVPWDQRPAGRPVSSKQRSGVAFIGGFCHAPNVDAARFLVEDIMPIVWQAEPGIECLLVGSDMPEQVKALARQGVTVLGAVADLADVLGKVRLTVAPLRYGAGVKGKVLSSLAAGVPCVMSQIAAEGIDLPPVLRACIGVDAASLAACILRLHGNAELCRGAARAGSALVATRYSADSVDRALGAAIEGRQPYEPAPALAATG
jgi:glycosyltransferase involved in cell wall biosynthesis